MYPAYAGMPPAYAAYPVQSPYYGYPQGYPDASQTGAAKPRAAESAYGQYGQGQFSNYGQYGQR